MKLFVLFIAVCSLFGCSNRGAYNALQTSQRNECEILQGVQRQECLSRLTMSYDEYQQARKKLLEDSEN
jgi:hypothetical protein